MGALTVVAHASPQALQKFLAPVGPRRIWGVTSLFTPQLAQLHMYR